MTPKPCPVCGAPAVEQVRGDMGPGDYYQDRLESPLSSPFGNAVPDLAGGPLERVPFYTLVECNPADRDDRRIACSKCSHATGWSKASFVEIAAGWHESGKQKKDRR